VKRLLESPQNSQTPLGLPRTDHVDRWSDEGRARKRLRLSMEGPRTLETPLPTVICRKLAQMLSGQPAHNLVGLSKTSP